VVPTRPARRGQPTAALPSTRMGIDARRTAVAIAGGLVALTALTALYVRILAVGNAVVVSTTFLLVVLLVAASSTLTAAVATSLAATLCFNFFFLPPVRTFTIAEPQNWVALGAFLVVSVVGSNLSARVRAQAREASARREELARLYDLSRDVLLAGDTREGRLAIVHAIARRFDLPFASIALPISESAWDIVSAGPRVVDVPGATLTEVLAEARRRVEFDAEARTYAGHRTMDVQDTPVALVPLRVGTRPIGLLAASAGVVDAGTLDAIGGLAAMAIERLQMLDERRDAALLKQSEALKSTLLASLGHDLRTPLTTIRIGAENLRSGGLPDDEREEQAGLVLAEAGRLERLFANVLDMARLEAGAVTADLQRTHPDEVVEAARSQVANVLDGHRVTQDLQVYGPVLLDPRLTATALARLLENAAQYAPPDSTIGIATRRDQRGVRFEVRDHGPGIPPGDLAHVFERFYRGAGSSGRPTGTGMGLWIARGLLSAQGAQVWVDQPADGGSLFTILVPPHADDAHPTTEPMA
ncbi:MAG TPA: ATP-binding protein, partial [Luteitalea sp.]|nr:ATP-binding protein [Luteitalea sp.]